MTDPKDEIPLEEALQLGVDPADVPLPDLQALLRGRENHALADHGLAPRAPVEQVVNPIQKPGVDPLLHRATVGGPHTGQDVRMVISASLLVRFLEVALASETRRVVIFQAGVLVTTYRQGSHVFQVLTLTGKEPVPEIPVVLGPQTLPAEEPFQESRIVPGLDLGKVVSERMIGGPQSGRDFRLFLSSALLEAMLDRARASRTSRAAIHGAGLVIDTYMGQGGAPYQTMTIMGRPPVPETPTIIHGSSVG